MPDVTGQRRSSQRGIAIVFALVLGVVGSTLSTPAGAVSLQRICSSGGSVIGSSIKIEDVETRQPMITALKRGECALVERGTVRVIIRDAKSYRVGYNLGPYSKDCRTNNRFIPWTKANTIYLRVYTSASCINP